MRDTQLETADSQLGTSIRNTNSISPSAAHAHPLHAGTPDDADPKGRQYPLSYTIFGSADFCFPFSYRGALSTTPTTSKNKNKKPKTKKFIISYFSKNKTKQNTNKNDEKENKTKQNKKNETTNNGNNKTDQRVCVKSKHSEGKVSSK